MTQFEVGDVVHMTLVGIDEYKAHQDAPWWIRYNIQPHLSFKITKILTNNWFRIILPSGLELNVENPHRWTVLKQLSQEEKIINKIKQMYRKSKVPLEKSWAT